MAIEQGRSEHRAGSLFDLDGEGYEIASMLERWYEPSATYFKVRTTDFRVSYCGMTSRPTDGRCRAASTATSYQPELASRFWCPTTPT
jgi:hypothetical protein